MSAAEAWARAQGAEVGPLRGQTAVLSFGDPAGEAEALAASEGFVPLLSRTLIKVTGADAVDFLHRMLTQDVQGLAPEHGAAACLLSPTGRILGHMLVWKTEEELLLDVAPGAAARALPVLERYVIADDVVFEDVTSRWARALLLGSGDLFPPVPPGVIVDFILVPPATGRQHRMRRFGRRVGGHDAVEVLLAVDVADNLAGVAVGLRPCGERALDVLRVEEVVPAYGAELDERVLPNEAGLDDAVSYTKGCYPGQEPVIMARHRGHPPNRLVRVRLEGAPGAQADTVLLREARPIGRLTTVVTARAGGLEALAYVRHALAQPGAQFEVAGGGRATLAEAGGGAGRGGSLEAP